mgnify:CR=1 FL=1
MTMPRNNRWTGGSLATPIAVRGGLVLLALLTLGLIGRLLAYPVQHDEQIHVAAGVLLSQFGLYDDLGYNHLPNLPLLLNAVYTLTGTASFVLVGRFLAVLWWLAAIGALLLIGWRRAGPLPALWGAILLVTNVLFLTQAGMLITNNVAPIPFALLGLHFFLRAHEDGVPRPLLSALAGFFIAVAIGFKVNYIFLIPPFAVAALAMPRGWTMGQRLGRTVLPMLGGGVIGSMPTLLFLAADTQSFLAHTMRYFTGAHRLYWLALDAPKNMSLTDKVLIAESVWFAGATLLAAAAALAFALLPFFSADERPRAARGPALLALGLAITGAAISFLPSPAFPQYYTPPMVFIVVLAVLLYARLGGESRRLGGTVLAAAAILAIAGSASRLGPGLMTLVIPSKWEGVRIHKQAARIPARAGDGTHAPGTIATLSPIYALEAGARIYPEFAAGPFLYRVADFIPSDDRRHFRTTSQRDLARFLDAEPPSAIVTGEEGQLDQAFVNYAKSRGFLPPRPITRDGAIVVFERSATPPVPGFSKDIGVSGPIPPERPKTP